MEIFKVFPQDRVRRSGLRTRSLTFQFQVEVLKIFLKLLIVQGFRPIFQTRQLKGFLALFPEIKKCEDPAHTGVRTGCAVELKDAMSCWLWHRRQHGGQGDRHGCGSSLVAERQEWSWLVRFLLVCLTQWLEQPLVQAVRGCRALSAFCSFWKNFLFHVDLLALFALGKLDNSPLPSYLSALVLVYECCLWSTAYWIFREILRALHLGR